MTHTSGPSYIARVIVIGLLWGLNWPAVKFMLSEIAPITIRAVAFTAAAILLTLVCLSKKQSLTPMRTEILPIIGTGLLMMFGFNVLISFGQILTETSRAAIIAFTMPAITAVASALLFKERLQWRVLLALVLAMSGIGFLISENLNAFIREPLGPIIMLVAACSWAFGTLAMKSRTWSLRPLALTVWFFAVSALACWPFVLVIEPPWQREWPSLPVMLTMVSHILGPMVISYAIWMSMIERLTATVAALATLITPLVGVLSAVALLGDPLTWQKSVALMLILISIYLTLMHQSSRA